MWNSYRNYLSKFPSDSDSELFDFEIETDSDFFCGNEIDPFMDEDINDLEDLFWNK
jgi:hypothetical protein